MKLYFAFRQKGTRWWWVEILRGFLCLIIWKESQEGFLFPTTHPFFPERQLVENSTSKLETGFACWVADIIITQSRDYQPRTRIPFLCLRVFFNWNRFLFMFYAVLILEQTAFYGQKRKVMESLLWFTALGGACKESTMNSASLQCWASPGSPFGFILVWLLPIDRVLISSNKNLGTHSQTGSLSTYLVNS